MAIVLVHGTGVRLQGFVGSFDIAKKAATQAGLKEEFVACAWGDPLGVVFEGKSVPAAPSDEKLKEEADDFARWSWLFDDPLFELGQLTIRDTSILPPLPPPPGVKPNWEELWDRIAGYKPSHPLGLLLERGGLTPFWQSAWSKVTVSPVAREAFEASAHELPEASHALARAIIAQLHVTAIEATSPGPSRGLRSSLFERLITDWQQNVSGPGAFFTKIFARLSTTAVRRHRHALSDRVALPIGDVILYQSRGEEIRRYIRTAIESTPPPVTLVAHSLGGIACVDLLALPNPPPVAHLVTVGSQAPLLYEIGALFSLKQPQPLPQGFPPWLNLFDRNDFLSYVASPLWPNVRDEEIESGQPFPHAHSAYFGNEATWQIIREFIK